MNRTLLLASAAVFALSAGVVSAKPAHPGVASPKGTFGHQTVFKTPKGAKTLYDQNANDSGVGLVSDNFTSGAFPSYSDQGADDFTVPAGHKWIVSEVDVTGVYFNGPGPATGVNVYFYKNKKGLPSGSAVATVTGASFTDNFGSFAIKTGKVKLKAGTYSVSVQADMNFTSGAGEWGWEVNSVQTGSEAAWQDPGGGFGVCPTWAPVTSCLGYGPDFMFTLKGKDKS